MKFCVTTTLAVSLLFGYLFSILQYQKNISFSHDTYSVSTIYIPKYARKG